MTTAAGLLKETAGGEGIAEVQGLVLSVMAEAAKGSKSKWADYLSFIPRDMSHMPMNWEVRVGCVVCIHPC